MYIIYVYNLRQHHETFVSKQHMNVEFYTLYPHLHLGKYLKLPNASDILHVVDTALVKVNILSLPLLILHITKDSYMPGRKLLLISGS